MTPEQTQALETVIEYLWHDEEQDYECRDDEERKGHVFASLVILDEFLAATQKENQEDE
jgi:hypothetical protein